MTAPTKPRLLFCSRHCYLDPSSGAALATRDLLEMLGARGWACGVLCGSRTDFEQGIAVEELLARCAASAVRVAHDGPFRVHQFVRAGVPITLHEAAGQTAPSAQERRSFVRTLSEVARLFRPDLLLSYGGDPLTCDALAHARSLGLPIVFCLLNDAYQERAFFRAVDAVLVHSDFARAFYQQRLGIESTSLPCPLPWHPVRCESVEPRYATFVNPQPVKGAALFARLALELGRQRPDIPLLVVEGRGGPDWMARCRLDLSGLRNLSLMRNTPDPRHFYQVSRAVLMPSLWPEMFGRVAAEAMINGIPVLASRRGGLPQTVGDAGILLDVPARYTGRTLAVPTAAEVAPWVEALTRLWDDSAFFAQRQQACRVQARTWHPDQLAPRYEAFFQQVLHGTAPRPMV